MKTETRDTVLEVIRTVCIAITTLILVVGFIISFVTILPEFPTRTFIKSIADEAVQTVTTVIVAQQNNPEAGWGIVYNQSTVEAGNKDYIKPASEGHETSEYWKGPNRLLTKIERSEIRLISKADPEEDTKWITQSAWIKLRAEKKLSRVVKTSDNTVTLSPYEKIGIIRGYIEEIRHSSEIF